MLLPETKEREYRFKLALRIGLPIFALVIALISKSFISNYESLDTFFYIEITLLIAFSIYFIFYIIYSSFDVKITDEVTKTFTREYLYKFLKKEIKDNNNYTLILISVDNIPDINTLYGIKNGDKILHKTASWIGEFFEEKGISNFPLGHIKGGDFIIGLKGNKNLYSAMLELMLLKSENFKIDAMEVKISGAITDTYFSTDLDYLIENLFELQINKRNSPQEEDINPSELESFVINAMNQKRFIVLTQDVFQKDKAVFKECFIKLKTPQNSIIHQKSYMKVINRLGLMLEYDLMILETIFSKHALFGEEIIAITVSPTSLRNQNFLSRTNELLEANTTIKHKIMFIFSEREYYSQISRYNASLKSLRNMGVLIAVDRLGSLHTSFLYLRDLDIDVIRFDALYIKEIQKKEYVNILDGLNVMAHNSGVKTWMKMLESKESVSFIEELAIDFSQGNFLAPLVKIYES